jgi:2-keto-3-deoxy-L-rhamnonate aldolase RhmA
MSAESFKTRLTRGDLLVGTLVTLASPDVADVLSRVGFDYLWIDMEHSGIGPQTAQAQIQAMGGRCASLIRVPANDAVWIKKALDTGCDGVVVPMVNTGDEARRAATACYYPPLGERSMGVARAQGYGLTFDRTLAEANDRIAVVIQVEHIDAVGNIDALVAVPGIDAVLIGPFDLSASLGRPGAVDHPDTRQAVETVVGRCQAAGKPVGRFCPDTAGARRAVSRGARLIALGLDAAYLWGAAGKALEQLRGAMD